MSKKKYKGKARRLRERLLKKRRRVERRQKQLETYGERLTQRNFASEAWFLNLLKEAGVMGWLQNHPVNEYYIGDFVFVSQRLILEIDGSWHSRKEVRERDEQRDSRLTREGWVVIRIRHPEDMGIGAEFVKKLKNLLLRRAPKAEISHELRFMLFCDKINKT